MSQHKRNDELTDATIQPYPPKEPNAESIEAIHEGNAFFASGELGRFGNAADLIHAALKAPSSVSEFNNRRDDCLGSVRLARYVPRHFYAIFGSARKNRKSLSTT